MRYPSFLPKNGTIGFVAPSFGCATEPYATLFTSALDYFHSQGFGTDIGPNATASSGIGISNTPEKCGEELNDYYCSGKNDALISCGGGELMCEVIPYMDFDRIREAKPKWYMGYSDNTNFTFLVTTLCDVASIYGPCASSFGMKPLHPSLTDALSVMKGETSTVSNYPFWELHEPEHAEGEEADPFEPYNTTEPFRMVTVPDEDISIEGRLIGGCVDCLVNLLGTRFDRTAEFADRYQEDGIIWFLECCDLNVMSMRRAFWQMREAGWFRHVKGFLIGRPMHYHEDAFGLDQYQAVTEILKEFNVPIIMDLDIGHLPPSMPVVCGAAAKIRTKAGKFEMEYTWK